MKIEICIQLILILLEKKKVSAKYLANTFLVSTKTIYRYLSYLDMCNIPIMTKRGRDGGIYLLNTIDMPSIYLTNAEKFVLQDKIDSIDSDEIRDSLKLKLGL